MSSKHRNNASLSNKQNIPELSPKETSAEASKAKPGQGGGGHFVPLWHQSTRFTVTLLSTRPVPQHTLADLAEPTQWTAAENNISGRISLHTAPVNHSALQCSCPTGTL